MGMKLSPGGLTSRRLRQLRWVGMAGVLAFMGWFLWQMRGMTPQQLTQLAPGQTWAAVLWLLGLYLAKSLSVFFPIAVLQLAAGLLFPTGGALAVNLAGALLGSGLGYLLGRMAGRETVLALLERYPKGKPLLDLCRGQELFFVYMARIAGVFPMDLVSMLMGALEIRPGRYLLGTLLGMLPGILAITLIGGSLTQMDSPVFWWALGGQLTVTVLSLAAYRLWLKKQKKQK